MTPQEKYAGALQELIEAQKEIAGDNNNPFDLGTPVHTGLSPETFISDDELNQLSTAIENSVNDNKQFAKILTIGNEILLKAKAILL